MKGRLLNRTQRDICPTLTAAAVVCGRAPLPARSSFARSRASGGPIDPDRRFEARIPLIRSPALAVARKPSDWCGESAQVGGGRPPCDRLRISPGSTCPGSTCPGANCSRLIFVEPNSGSTPICPGTNWKNTQQSSAQEMLQRTARAFAQLCRAASLHLRSVELDRVAIDALHQRSPYSVS